MKEPPKILVITEEPLRENSLGFGRTLTNILKNYPSEKILFYVPDGDYKSADFFKFGSRYITFQLKRYFYSAPRFYSYYINSFIQLILHSYQYCRKIKATYTIKRFDPDIILSVPMLYETVLESYKVSNYFRETPLVLYLMDDISSSFTGWHLGGRRDAILLDLLVKADGWIMISSFLTNSLKNKCGVHPSRSIVIHNPIDYDTCITKYNPIPNKEYFTIAYAGSIHPFHLDALIYVAESVYSLQEKGVKIKLVLYTRDVFWQPYERIFLKNRVEFGGLLSYDDLFQVLNQHNLLLCTTSFDKQHYTFTSTSVFTKLTDYFASARPVWSVGPKYAANNLFLRENGVGLVTDSNQLDDICDFLERCIRNEYDLEDIVKKQTFFLDENNNSRKVMIKFLDFLKSLL